MRSDSGRGCARRSSNWTSFSSPWEPLDDHHLDVCLAQHGRTMGLLTFALNVTLDGCHDHREMIADEELHDHFTQLIGGAGAMLYGRTTYELMEGYWPAVARDEKAPRAEREW